MASPRIAVHSIPDLKNTTDDALPNYLRSLSFTQSHLLTDVRLALGYAAVFIAAVTFYFDYRLGFEKTKGWTLYAVLAYFFLNGGLTCWVWGVEKGKVFVGCLGETKEQLTLQSHVEKHIPTYHVTVRYRSSVDQDIWQTVQISAPFTEWFTTEGYFVAKPFQRWLASEILVIGNADPGNAGGGGQAGQSIVKTLNVSQVEESVEHSRGGHNFTGKDVGNTSTRSRSSKK
ncbi:MAG: hypothetical protein M1827_006976 [Pycnora praestabilis]|nr:MAG: hypothetical protein M1827_006976 [Pycnora praestabilis]